MASGRSDKKEARPATPAKAKNSAGVFLKGVSLSRMLGEELIIVGSPARAKEELIEILVRRLCEKRSLKEPGAILKKVLERETEFSTVLDTGLGVPHARLDDLENFSAALALVPKGIPDVKQPDLIIRAMFLLLSPKRKEAFISHLHIMRGVPAFFQPAVIDELLRAPDAAGTLRIIVEKESAV